VLATRVHSVKSISGYQVSMIVFFCVLLVTSTLPRLTPSLWEEKERKLAGSAGKDGWSKGRLGIHYYSLFIKS